VNTFILINSEGKERYVKFIWTPKGGEGGGGNHWQQPATSQHALLHCSTHQ